MADISMGDKLYLVTRNDLKPGQQASQLCHAIRLFVQEHPEVDKAWYENSNTLALLSVPGEGDLVRLFERLRFRGIKCSLFREEDLNNEATSLAAEPLAKRTCSELPSALR